MTGAWSVKGKKIRKELKEEACKMINETPKTSNVSGKVIQNVVKGGVKSPLKSPSDTTIYAPGLAKAINKNRENSGLKRTSTSTNVKGNQQSAIIEKISNFVDQIRLQQGESSPSTNAQQKETTAQIIPSGKDLVEAGGSGEADKQYEQDILPEEDAKAIADRLILESEQFKAALEKPIGNVNIVNSVNSDKTTLSDDDFFHLMCHVDQITIAKIEKGEYVDFEKLYPQDKVRRPGLDHEEDMVLKQRNGSTFLGPAAKDRKITSVRKWEKSFRIYATIYCKANPIRTAEIWQYIEDINTAAAAYVWDNVANYDYVFRQLMAFNPKRSWTVTYTKMWNLSMVEPISKNSYKDRSSNGYKGNKNGDTPPKAQYCWPFNRGYCKYGKKCRYINRCSYCDSPKHGRNSCYKLNGKSTSNNSSSNGGGGKRNSGNGNGGAKQQEMTVKAE